MLTVGTKHCSHILICHNLLTRVGLRKLMVGSLIGPLFLKPQSYSELISCNCKKRCAGQCKCSKAAFKYTALCLCFGVCYIVIINYAVVSFYVLMLFYVASVLISITKITNIPKLIRIDPLTLQKMK